MNALTTLKSKLISLPHNNIDTDQIIPTRFLKVTDKESTVKGLFADWRYYLDGSSKPGFILNQPEYQDAQIIIAGDNFGCGSSREHALWALVGWGIRAVISTSFADIFMNNALKNGLLPIRVNNDIHKSLFAITDNTPMAELSIDLGAQSVTLPDGSSFKFHINGFAKKCLMTGLDQLGYILSFEKQIIEYEIKHKALIITEE